LHGFRPCFDSFSFCGNLFSPGVHLCVHFSFGRITLDAK
jgi:hypothetical protein